MQSRYSSFNGNNNLSTKQAFNERLKYEIGIVTHNVTGSQVVDETQIPKPMKKFFVGEYQYYGKVDENLQAVFAKKEKLKLISQKNGLFVLDFVQKQFNLLVETFTKCATIGTIKKDDKFLSVIKPEKAFISLDDRYNEYMSNLITDFNNIEVTRNATKILDFNNYMDFFIKHNSLNAQTNPMTKSGFLKSNFCPMNVSGLVIEITNLQYSNDTQKFNFVQSPNFDFFMNACIKHGFFIDYNSPWRIVADIDSPVMIDAMASLGYNRDFIFQSHFDNVTNLEIQNIRDMFYNGYNTFVKRRPFEKLVYECTNKTLKSQFVDRPLLTKASVTSMVSDQEALKIYIKMRANEQNVQFSDQELTSITSKTLSQTSNLGTNFGLNYVESQIKQKELVGSGTINSIVLSLENRLKGS